MHGSGTFSWADGRRYEGEYVNDQKEGKGIYYYHDGRKYDGEWKNNRQDGVGYFTDLQGVVTKAEYSCGKKVK